MTMSEGDCERIPSRPLGMSTSEEARWDWTWERRWRAKKVVRKAGHGT